VGARSLRTIEELPRRPNEGLAALLLGTGFFRGLYTHVHFADK
jgi:hypothetical protein